MWCPRSRLGLEAIGGRGVSTRSSGYQGGRGEGGGTVRDRRWVAGGQQVEHSRRGGRVGGGRDGGVAAQGRRRLTMRREEGGGAPREGVA
jgi:hypothetical protein